MNHLKPRTSFADVETVFMNVVGAQAIQEAVKMNLFDHISQTPMTASELAEQHGIMSAPLEAMLDMFAAMGIVTREEDRFTTSDMADEYLVSTSPFFQGRALAVEFGFSKDLGEQLPTLLKGQSPAREQTDETWATRETMEGTLQHALGGQLQGAVEFLAGLPEFRDFRSMADIGGNHGQYSMELLDRNPSLGSTILDLPHVVPVSRERCAAQGYGDRIACRAFDMRNDELPEAAFDLIFTSHVLYGCVDNLDAFFTRVRTACPPAACSPHTTSLPKAARPRCIAPASSSSPGSPGIRRISFPVKCWSPP